VLTVLIGGARAGKSAQAERIARNSGDDSVTFIATCPRLEGDDELAERIERHRSERPTEWATVEEEIDLAGALDRAGTSTAIIDCLTTWVANMLHHGHSDLDVLREAEDAIAVVRWRDASTVVVTNEVGQGIVPADADTRRYRDLLGRVNQQWVSVADRAYLMVSGRALELHPIEDTS
jgi:adenosyl cobinamide kinase/adenosyl cobinamide phosphate guanylyltransferase